MTVVISFTKNMLNQYVITKIGSGRNGGYIMTDLFVVDTGRLDIVSLDAMMPIETGIG